MLDVEMWVSLGLGALSDSNLESTAGEKQKTNSMRKNGPSRTADRRKE